MGAVGWASPAMGTRPNGPWSKAMANPPRTAELAGEEGVAAGLPGPRLWSLFSGVWLLLVETTHPAKDAPLSAFFSLLLSSSLTALLLPLCRC